MNIAKTRLRTSRVLLGRLAMALVLAGMVGGIAAAPARADDDRHHREEWRGEHRARGHDREEWRERHSHERHVFVAPEPVYVAPPPVVYAPPPSGINLVFPIQIR